MFDLNLLPLNFIEGQEQTSMPELFATGSPRRAARGRDGDALVILLNLQGSAPLSPASQKQLLERLSQTFYQTSGSVTAGLRAMSEALNQYLLDRNLHITSAGRQALGLLNIVVIHNDSIILAQSGPTHAFIISNQAVDHFTDPTLAGRGLGLSRTPAIRFSQTEAAPGKCVILCPEPPIQWNSGLAGLSAQNIETIRSRLLSAPQSYLSAVLIQLQNGSGKVNLISSAGKTARPLPPQTGAPATAKVPATPTTVSPIQAVSDKSAGAQAKPSPTQPPAPTPSQPNAPAAAAGKVLQPAASQTAQPPVKSPPAPAPTRADAARLKARPAVKGQAKSQAASPAKGQARGPAGGRPAAETTPGEPVIQQMKRTRQNNFLVRGLASVWARGHSAGQSLVNLLKRSIAGTLPSPVQPSLELSTGTMVFIAVAVPLIVVAVAMVVYYKKGQTELYQSAFAQAQATANETQIQTDPLVIHNTWERTLTQLSTAEAYQQTDATRALRAQAQSSLDSIDGIVRLNFQNAIVGGLAQNISVIRMVATANDLYMLDAGQGRVLRATLTGRGYEVDPSFICGPGDTGSLTISKLVSIAALPINNPLKASIMGMDQNGNLLYCLPSGPAIATQLAPPDNNWGKIAGFIFDSDTLYVLDPPNNAIEVYTSSNGSFNERPHLYFDNSVPNLKDVIDLAINGQDIYMLHADGHMSMCTSSQVVFVPTRCSDPATYSDPRPGRKSGTATISDGQFTQMIFTAPPDPSIFMLSPAPASISHFSLRLNLQRVLRPLPENLAYLPAAKATAFTIGINRNAFMALGNQVLYASIP